MQKFLWLRSLLCAGGKMATIATTPRSSFPASSTPQKTNKLKGSMIDLCITQDILDHLKWAIFMLIQNPRWALCPARSSSIWGLHPPIKHHSDNHYGFNANGTRPMGKINLRCQIGDLKSEVTCYVIDDDTLYNLLLGRSWIHRNSIISSTLHQVIKYVDEEGKVRTLIAKRYLFKGVENYFTDSLLYQNFLDCIHKNLTLAMKLIQSQKKKSVTPRSRRVRRRYCNVYTQVRNTLTYIR